MARLTENSSASSAIECSPSPWSLSRTVRWVGLSLGALPLSRPLARDRHSFASAHPQQVDLKLSERREDVEKALAHRVAGVIDRAAEREPNASSGQRVADRSRVGDAASEAVELGHHQRVAFPQCGQGVVEPRPGTGCAGQAVVEVDPLLGDPEPAEDRTLSGEILLFSRPNARTRTEFRPEACTATVRPCLPPTPSLPWRPMRLSRSSRPSPGLHATSTPITGAPERDGPRRFAKL